MKREQEESWDMDQDQRYRIAELKAENAALKDIGSRLAAALDTLLTGHDCDCESTDFDEDRELAGLPPGACVCGMEANIKLIREWANRTGPQEETDE